MSTQTINRGTETAITATNLNSLANNALKVIGGAAIDDSSVKAEDYELYVEVTLGSSGVGASGTLEVYLFESTESATADFTDGIDPTSSSDQASLLKNGILLRSLNANANNQVVRAVMSILSDLRGQKRNCPKYWVVGVLNKSSATTAASGNEMTQTAIKHDIA